MRFILLCTLIIYFLSKGYAQVNQLKFYPTSNSIGYKISFISGFDDDLNATAVVTYYANGQTVDTAFAPYRLKQDTLNELRGSIFMLKPNTKYYIQVTVIDSTPTHVMLTFNDSITTKSLPQLNYTSNIKYVSPSGSGNSYTITNPGNIQTLITNNLVTCGTTVVLMDGIYEVGSLELNFLNDCSEQDPILFVAAPGANPIFNGGYYQNLSWTKHPYDSTLYSATLPSECSYTTLCLFNNQRLFPYGSLTMDPFNTFPINVLYPFLQNVMPMQNLGYGISGFCRDNSTIWIKTLNNQNPNQSNIILSQREYAFNINGNNRNLYLGFKGITFRYYNKPFINASTGSSPSFTLKFKDANYVRIDSCIFEYSNNPIIFEGNCNYNYVSQCNITDQTGLWPHRAFKESPTESYAVNTTVARNLENTGINFRPNYGGKIIGNVIKNCTINGVVAGIVVGHSENSMLIEETDICDNKLVNCYDGIDVLNGQVNARVWNNEIGYSVVGLSFISGRFGPRYVFRNLVHHTLSRKNPSRNNTGIVFVDCNGTASDKIWGSGIKLNASGNSPYPASLFLMHNTFHAKDTLAFNMYLWRSDWSLLYSRNNIYYSEGISNFFFDDIANDNQYSFSSVRDNFFNLGNTVATIQPVNGNNLCYTVDTPTRLDSVLRSTTQSQKVSIQNSKNLNPQFVSNINNFQLLCTSPLIDNGIWLKGINTRFFKGIKPDIGAYEFEKQLITIFIEDTVSTRDTIIQTDYSGNTLFQTVYDTIYSNTNEILYDTLSNISCSLSSSTYSSIDSSYVTINIDTIDACSSINLTSHTVNYINSTIYQKDSIYCDTTITYHITVKINAVGLPPLTNQKIEVYPNPASDYFYITGNEKEIYSIKLIDPTGRVLILSANNNIINLKNISPGFYIVVLEDLNISKLLVTK